MHQFPSAPGAVAGAYDGNGRLALLVPGPLQGKRWR